MIIFEFVPGVDRPIKPPEVEHPHSIVLAPRKESLRVRKQLEVGNLGRIAHSADGLWPRKFILRGVDLVGAVLACY